MQYLVMNHHKLGKKPAQQVREHCQSIRQHNANVTKGQMKCGISKNNSRSLRFASTLRSSSPTAFHPIRFPHSPFPTTKPNTTTTTTNNRPTTVISPLQKNHHNQKNHSPSSSLQSRQFSAQDQTEETPTHVRIGSSTTRYCRHKQTRGWKVPFFRPFPPQIRQREARYLEWMIEKDSLNQDMLLLGYPGKQRRHLARLFAYLTGREYEYIAITRDTTEEDIKQRRELIHKASVFHDQPAVTAAKNGSLLILDGLEKAERNLLPILNNLLENREMELEDGHFLISDYKYQKLQARYSSQEILEMNLIPVSPNFRVVGLTSPNPPFYPGVPLDPPLRSRFQIKYVGPESPEEIFQELGEEKSNSSAVKNIVWFQDTLRSISENLRDVGTETKILDFPQDNLRSFAGSDLLPSIQRIYPYSVLLKDPLRRDLFQKTFEKFYDHHPDKIQDTLYFKEIRQISATDIEVILERGSPNCSEVKLHFATKHHSKKKEFFKGFILTEKFVQIVASIFVDFSVGKDVLILGPRSSGKSELARHAAEVFGPYETMTLFQDMSANDLFSTRYIDEEGNTKWKWTPLVKAAVEGRVCIIDNLDQVDESVQTVLAELCQDRYISNLPDGTRLVPPHADLTEEDRAEQVYKISPHFRLISIFTTDRTKKRLVPETLPSFHFSVLEKFSKAQIADLVSQIVPQVAKENIYKLVQLSHLLDTAEDSEISYSLRQIIRDAKLLAQKETQPVSLDFRDIQHSFITKWLPDPQKKLLDKCVREAKITQSGPSKQRFDTMPNGQLTGSASAQNAHLVPHIEHFFENPNHLKVLHKLFQLFQLNVPCLLIGPQGTGKNKIVDFFCQHFHLPREYIQLHRDIRLEGLVVRPKIRLGRIYYEDSPVIKAIKYGRVLVVDEADKCNPEVVLVLKNILEGELNLIDGRKVRKADYLTQDEEQESDILRIHPDFRMVVLANKPGFPFHGNNFFGQIGDMFATFEIDNPDIDSEMKLLSSYAPSVNKSALQLLATAFQELRDLDLHPYSSRESCNIARTLYLGSQHQDQGSQQLQKTLSTAMADALDGEAFADSADKKRIRKVLERLGLRVPATLGGDTLGTTGGSELESKPLYVEYLREKSAPVSEPKFGKVDPENTPHVGGNTWAGGTGGRDTAGLGGKGGYMRLDAGHPIHQLSDAEKKTVPLEIQQKMRQMAQDALKMQLAESKLTERELESYRQFYEKILPLKAQLREALAVPEEERIWVKNTDQGEIDQSKLVDLLAGSKRIYKQRRTVPGFFQQNKSISFLLDVSASMYRFNRYDGRLDRILQVALAVMESLHGISNLSYEIRGHSGDDPAIEFVSFDRQPLTVQERYQVLRRISLYPQFCWPGDTSLEALKQAITQISKRDTEQNYVFFFSDANFDRYDISPHKLKEILHQNENVKAFSFFIGSFDNEADLISKIVGPRAVAITDLEQLPTSFKKVLIDSQTKGK